jgi:hypothetical protein
MNVTKYYNFLDGANLCNIFASLIVNKINESFPNAKTEISVINVRNFFIIKGKTSSDKPLLIADIFQEFVSEYDQELSKTIRVIDVINYNVDFNYGTMVVDYYSNKKNDDFSIQSFVNSYVKENKYFNIKIDEVNNVLYYDCTSENQDFVFSLLEEKFKDYLLIKSDFSQETYVSEKFYGLSNNNEKLYHMLVRYIFHNLSMVGISRELNIKLVSDIRIDDVDNESIKLYIFNDNHIVKTSWLESLILDVFPFTKDSLSDLYSPHKLDHIDDIINGEINSPWKKLNLINELVLF